MRRRWLIPTITLLLVAALALAWARGRTNPTPLSAASAPASQIVVTSGDLAAIVEATGRVDATRRAKLSLPIGGPITAVNVEVGDLVEAGTPLLSLDTTELQLKRQEALAGLAAAQAQLARAEAGATPAEIEAAQAQMRAAQLALAVAEAELDDLPEDEQAESEEAVRVEQARASLEGARATLRRLVEGASQEERAALTAQVEQAQARLAQADAALAGATLRAPFAGIITERLVTAGERASPSAPLLSLADPATLIVAAEVDEVDVGRVEPGQPVTITLDAFPARPLSGSVSLIAPAAGTPRAATTYRTIIAFDPADLPVRLDMAADLRIRTAHAEGVLLLPLSAIRYAETQPYVLVTRNGQITEQDVVLGAQDDRMVQILEGLQEGEAVIPP